MTRFVSKKTIIFEPDDVVRSKLSSAPVTSGRTFAPPRVRATMLSNTSRHHFHGYAEKYMLRGCRTVLRKSRPGGRAFAPSVGATASDKVTSDFSDFVLSLQNDIIKQTEDHIELKSGKTFLRDEWNRDGDSSGFGITSVLEGGDVVEKAASNVSVIHGRLTKARAQAMSSRGRDCIDPNGGQEYAAAAMSLVFHSGHPHIPTLRADVRVFEVAGQKWFGGGCDLTPFYIYEEDFTGFHQFWKDICDTYDENAYATYKAWCDDYFYIPARKEHRGVGGLFFDDLDDSSNHNTLISAEEFVRHVGYGILPSWMPIVERRKAIKPTEAEREWQLIRRGRYLEFNLLYDRGVKFGLEGGRIESIMVSAPPLISWKYNHIPVEGSREDDLLKMLGGSPRKWI